MNKNIGKKFLSVICVGLLVIGICLFSLGKNKGEVEDLYGKRSEMGDVSILLQSNKGMYETDEIKISKDSVNLNYMAKQGKHELHLSKKNIDAREALEVFGHGFIDYTDALLEDEDRLASVHLINEYIDEEKSELYVNIKIKYNNSDEVESYEIPMGDQSIQGSGLVYSSVPISIDKDNIYIVTLGSYHKEYEDEIHNEENIYDDFYKTELNLYKVNLSSKNSKHILNKEYDGKDIYAIGKVCFANKGKSYFVVNKKDDKKTYKSSLLEFDVCSKEIKNIDLGTEGDYIDNFSVDDNKLLLTSFNGIETAGNNTQLNSGNVRGILVDLENSKVESINHINIDAYEDDLLQVRRVGNKTYFVTEEYDKEDESIGKYSYCFSVFDEDKNEVVYKGRIKQNTSYLTQVGIVKEDEL